MMNLILFLIFIAASAVVGVSIAQDPGMLLIAHQHTTIEMPLWLGVIMAFIAVFVLYTAIRLMLAIVYAPTQAKAWLMQKNLRRARRRTVAGFIALAEGHWAKAEKLLVNSSHPKHTAVINYLCAATAAEKLGDTQKRDEYLRLAHMSDASAELAIGITAARLQMDSEQWEQSLATLTRLHHLEPDHDYVLQLMYKVLLQLKDWQGLLDLLPLLRKRKVIDEVEMTALMKRCYMQQHGPWQRIPSSLKQDADILLMYLPGFIAAHDSATAETLVKSALNHVWDERLVRYYASIQTDDLDKQIKTAEQWLKKHKDDPTLMFTMASLYARKSMWGQAKEMALASLHIKPTPELYELLGHMEAACGNQSAALKYYQSGLALSMSQ